MAESDNPKRKEAKEKPDRHGPMNDYVTYFGLQYLTDIGLGDESVACGFISASPSDSNIRRAVMTHFVGLGVLEKNDDRYRLTGELPTKEAVQRGKELVETMALFQKEAIEQKMPLHRLAKGRSAFEISIAAQSLMLFSYRNLFEHLARVDRGEVTGGRTQPENAYGAGEMFGRAAILIAKTIADRLSKSQISDTAILGLGSGNARLELEAKLTGFPWAKILVTDKDSATQSAANRLFEEKGLKEDIDFEWMPVDMGNAQDVAMAAQRLKGHRTVIHIGYILHESRDLARRTLTNIRTYFPDALLVVSEYFYQNAINPEVPLWFQTVHIASGQELFTYEEFIAFVKEYGNEILEPLIVHNPLPSREDPMNATLFLTQKVQPSNI